MVTNNKVVYRLENRNDAGEWEQAGDSQRSLPALVLSGMEGVVADGVARRICRGNTELAVIVMGGDGNASVTMPPLGVRILGNALYRRGLRVGYAQAVRDFREKALEAEEGQ